MAPLQRVPAVNTVEAHWCCQGDSAEKCFVTCCNTVQFTVAK